MGLIFFCLGGFLSEADFPGPGSGEAGIWRNFTLLALARPRGIFLDFFGLHLGHSLDVEVGFLRGMIFITGTRDERNVMSTKHMSTAILHISMLILQPSRGSDKIKGRCTKPQMQKNGCWLMPCCEQPLYHLLLKSEFQSRRHWPPLIRLQPHSAFSASRLLGNHCLEWLQIHLNAKDSYLKNMYTV